MKDCEEGVERVRGEGIERTRGRERENSRKGERECEDWEESGEKREKYDRREIWGSQVSQFREKSRDGRGNPGRCLILRFELFELIKKNKIISFEIENLCSFIFHHNLILLAEND